MPSIPQSLLWISLVVLWLFVLVPMLISKRDTVRRTSDVALATRVLNTGRASRLLRRHRPAAGHHSDPDWRPTRGRPRRGSTRTKTTSTDERRRSGPSCWRPPQCRPNPTTSTSTSSRRTPARCRSGRPPRRPSTKSSNPELPLEFDDSTQTFSVDDLSGGRRRGRRRRRTTGRARVRGRVRGGPRGRVRRGHGHLRATRRRHRTRLRIRRRLLGPGSAVRGRPPSRRLHVAGPALSATSRRPPRRSARASSSSASGC